MLRREEIELEKAKKRGWCIVQKLSGALADEWFLWCLFQKEPCIRVIRHRGDYASLDADLVPAGIELNEVGVEAVFNIFRKHYSGQKGKEGTIFLSSNWPNISRMSRNDIAEVISDLRKVFDNSQFMEVKNA